MCSLGYKRACEAIREQGRSEVHLKLILWAGLEKSNGGFVNAISQEAAAEGLRKALQAEKARL